LGRIKRIKIRYVAVFSVLAVLLFMNYVMPLIPGLSSLGARFMVVASGSMRPFLNLGDIVVLTGVNPEDVKVDDVIAFNVAARFQQQYNYPPVVTHRVIEVVKVGSDLYFQTKGDATEKDPFTVPAGDIVGVYAWKIPYVGIPFLFMRTVYGMALLASYVAMDLAFDYGPVWLKKRQEKEKTMATMLQETAGIRQALTSLSSSIARFAVSAQPAAGILLRRKSHGMVEVVEGSQPMGLTAKRRAAG